MPDCQRELLLFRQILQKGYGHVFSGIRELQENQKSGAYAAHPGCQRHPGGGQHRDAQHGPLL
ncbi:hypothetical protein D3C76_1703080 [compost metagenome]